MQDVDTWGSTLDEEEEGAEEEEEEEKEEEAKEEEEKEEEAKEVEEKEEEAKEEDKDVVSDLEPVEVGPETWNVTKQHFWWVAVSVTWTMPVPLGGGGGGDDADDDASDDDADDDDASIVGPKEKLFVWLLSFCIGEFRLPLKFNPRQLANHVVIS